MRILVFSEQASPRLDYVLDWLNGRAGACRFHRTCHAAEFAQYEGPRIHYGSGLAGGAALRLPLAPLLFEGGVKRQEVGVGRVGEEPCLFHRPDARADLPFDLFAAVFYMLSRYEEYLPFESDAHGRFPAECSLAARAGFLQQPVVDRWVMLLWEALQRRWPRLPLPEPSFRFLPTFDVDMAWAFRHKGALRFAGGLAKDLFAGQWKRLGRRLAVRFGGHTDPFDTFARLDALHRDFHLRPIWFFLVADYGSFDKNSRPGHPAFRQLVRRLGESYPIGLHPSYASAEEPERLALEKKRLEEMLGRSVWLSRQHYLRLRFPQTYRRLLRAGFRQDYSMGFADATGFRAGTAHPFRWYDLSAETTTELLVFPFQVMDVTLKKYLALSPEAALEHTLALARTVHHSGGIFSTLWHNSSFDEQEWKGWGAVYEGLLHRL